MASSIEHRSLIDVVLRRIDGNVKWDASNILSDVSLLSQISEYLTAAAGSADLICALRGSGLTLGSAMSAKFRRPLLWFEEATSDRLFPRGANLVARDIMIVDSHSVSGGTVMRHAEILRAMGARTVTAAVIIDADLHRSASASQFFTRTTIVSMIRMSTVTADIRFDRYSGILRRMQSKDYWN